jgi:hypothetical protein
LRALVGNPLRNGIEITASEPEVIIHEPNISNASSCHTLQFGDEPVDRFYTHQPAIFCKITKCAFVGTAIARLHGNNAGLEKGIGKIIPTDEDLIRVGDVIHLLCKGVDTSV